MKRNTLSMALALCGLTFGSAMVGACFDKSDDDDDDNRRERDSGFWDGSDSGFWDGRDSGWEWDSGTSDGGDGGGSSSTDSCDWGIDLCFEFVNYDSTQAWCDDIASLYSLSTQYGGECASGAVGQCDLTGVGGDIPSGPDNVTAFFYSPSYDARSAADSCSSAGGG